MRNLSRAELRSAICFAEHCYAGRVLRVDCLLCVLHAHLDMQDIIHKHAGQFRPDGICNYLDFALQIGTNNSAGSISIGVG